MAYQTLIDNDTFPSVMRHVGVSDSRGRGLLVPSVGLEGLLNYELPVKEAIFFHSLSTNL